MAHLTQKLNTSVMFSAYLKHPFTGPFNERVVFDGRITNIGHSYDLVTGVFTCKVLGYYVFDVHIMRGNNKYGAVKIRRDGEALVTASVGDEQHSSSAHVCVRLREGDTVYVLVSGMQDAYLSNGPFTTFSGHLVNPIM